MIKLAILSIDSTKKVRNHTAAHFLRVTIPQYQISVKLAGAPGSPSMSGMPGPTGFKQPDAAYERFVEQKEILRATTAVISALSPVSQTVLKGMIDGLPEHTIAYKAGYGHSQYYDTIRPRALHDFASFYPLDHFDEADTLI